MSPGIVWFTFGLCAYHNWLVCAPFLEGKVHSFSNYESKVHSLARDSEAQFPTVLKFGHMNTLQVETANVFKGAHATTIRGTNQTTYEQIKGAFSALVSKSTEAMVKKKGISSWELFPYPLAVRTCEWMILPVFQVWWDMLVRLVPRTKNILGSKLSTLPNS